MHTKTIGVVMLSVMLVFATFSSAAVSSTQDSDESNRLSETESGEYSAKDEAVYASLDANGILQNMYVVNTFHVTEPGEFVDHGDYTHIRNLSNLDEMEQTDDTIHFQAEEGEFYYQGEMDARSLPWDIRITYLLDGEEVRPDELPGKSGSLEIQISTSANEDMDPIFFENYLLQISLTLDPSKFDDIQAPEGTKATAGKNQLITFTVLPDQEEELIVSGNVSDFELDPIDISAAPYSMSIESPDLDEVTDEMEALSDAISDVNTGVSELNDGISELHAGVGDLSRGSREYLSGINELNQSSTELTEGSAAIQDALHNISESMQGSFAMPDVSELEALPEGFGQLADGLGELADGLATLQEHYGRAYSTLDQTMTGIPTYDIGEEEVAELLESGADPEVVGQLIETYEAARMAKETYNAVQEAFASAGSTLEHVSGSIREMANDIATLAMEIEGAMEDMDQMDQLDALVELQEGLSSLASEYESFHSGLVKYTDGLSQLASSYQELDSGFSELVEGTAALEDGAGELQAGTQELHEETTHLPDDMQSEVDEMMERYDASDFDPQSFVSAQNEKVEVVQFVLQTERIEVEELETTEEVDEEEKGFWERFLDLFR